MTEEEIMDLMPSDFRDLTQEEEMRDNFRRMFQIMGLIYRNQIEIRNKLETAS
jgi:hypothetical protein